MHGRPARWVVRRRRRVRSDERDEGVQEEGGREHEREDEERLIEVVVAAGLGSIDLHVYLIIEKFIIEGGVSRDSKGVNVPSGGAGR